MKNLQRHIARGNASSNGWWVSLSLLFILLLLYSCGGGGTNVAGGGIGGTGVISVGSITAFGSIWVNGVEYDTTASSITVNGTAASQANLTRGMIVRVDGTINTDGVSGNADTVTFSRDIAGTVTAVDLDNQTMTILGQTIAWDNKTFGDNDEPGVWTAPAIGDFIEISGIPTQDGWLARAINHHDHEDDNDISGLISNLDPMTHTFTINNLEIDYQGIMDTNLQNGDYIEVTGQLQDNLFYASRIEIRHQELAENGKDMEVEGLVQEYNAETKMLIIMGHGGTYTVDINGAVFEHGIEADLVTGAMVEAEGYIQDTLFFAEKIEFKGEH